MNMELPGSTYLLNLAVISITFVAFSTIIVIFREAQGAGLIEYDIVILRLFVVSGLEVTIFSLIPPLIELFGITPIWVWRISSLIFALVMIWRGMYFRRRQVRFERRRVIDVLYTVYMIAILGLLINALGIFFEPGAGLYALAATWLLVNAIIVFIFALERFLHPPMQDKS
jgi:hypothetical protein